MGARTLITLVSLATAAMAQYGYGGYQGGHGDDNSPYSGRGGGSGRDGDGDGNGGFSPASQSLNFDPRSAENVRLAHGVLASAAFVFFFPAGAIAIRTIPHRAAIWIHAAFQVFAYVLYIAAFGLGIWMVTKIRFANFNMLSSSATNYHPIIGIVVFILVSFQPILGVLHHLAFKKYQRRQIWSYGHIWLGRIVITLGIINGGLGLKLADNTRSGEVAYGVIAGIVWLAWVAAAIYGELKRARAQQQLRNGTPYKLERGRQSYSEEGMAGVDPAAVHAPPYAPPKYEPRYQ